MLIAATAAAAAINGRLTANIVTPHCAAAHVPHIHAVHSAIGAASI
jgi:hypothetical protein